MGRNIEDWPPVESAFLRALSATANVTEAARAAGISRQTAYERRESDPDFAAAWRDALEESCDALEREARRRAIEGTEEPVFYKGDECGRIRRYSDTLLIVLLNAHRPEKYRRNTKVEHDGQVTIRVEYADGGTDADAHAHEAPPEAG